MPENQTLTRHRKDTVELPPEVEREAFTGMLTILRGMGTNMTQRGEPLSQEVAYAMAIMACKLGLEPVMGHVLLLGNKPYVTVAGLLHNANKRSDFDGYEARPATAEERKEYYAPAAAPKDEHLWRCAVWMKERKYPTVAYGRCKVATHGIDERAGGSNRFTPSQQWSVEMAENRAIGRALRRAIHIGEASYEEMLIGPNDTGAVDATPTSSAAEPAASAAQGRRRSRSKPAPASNALPPTIAIEFTTPEPEAPQEAAATVSDPEHAAKPDPATVEVIEAEVVDEPKKPQMDQLPWE